MSHITSFTAKFKNVIWYYIQVQYYTCISFYEAKNKIDNIYLLANENGLNISENSAVQAKMPPFRGGV